jgi:hypothetical protein
MVSSKHALRSRLPSPRRARWLANWVAGDEMGARGHRADRAGVAVGRLELHPDALGFYATRTEDRQRGRPVLTVIELDAIRDVRLVPAGSGPDGRKRPAPGLRPPLRRLVLDTERGPYVFEVMWPARKARRLRAALTRA